MQIFQHIFNGARLVFGFDVRKPRAEIVVGSGWRFDDGALADEAFGGGFE